MKTVFVRVFSMKNYVLKIYDFFLKEINLKVVLLVYLVFMQFGLKKAVFGWFFTKNHNSNHCFFFKERQPKGIVQSQIIRFHRICNNTKNFDNACSILFRTLKHRGYAPRFLRTMKKRNIVKTSTKWQIFQM